MRIKIPRLILSNSIPGFEKFNRWIDHVVTFIENAANPSTTGIISVTSSPAGLHFHVPEFPISVALTTSTITARSGSTPGSGTATLQLFNGTTFVSDAARVNQTVYNFSSGGTVASAKYCIVLKVFGFWFIVATEC